ncbi:MFS transporter [Gracilibacillus sp. JCM 18860]|uniref:MFS transporter n=1 Tax=Gracilibacillus sp. JCM 18860 TaxID=1306159 RepID=UPI0006CFCC21
MILGAATTALWFPITINFEHLLILNIIYFFFHSAIPPIADVTAISIIGSRKDFGKIRLWGGSIGYAVGGVVAIGRLLDIFGLDIMFVLHSSLIVFALILALQLPVQTAKKKQFHLKKVIRLFYNPAFSLFLIFSFFLHLPVHANNSFYAVYLQDLGASISLVGIALLIKSILEVPFFSMSKKLMSVFTFPILLTSVAFFYGLRWLVLGISDNLDTLVWSQILLSLSYSIHYFVAVAYVDELTPIKYRATGQTIYWAVALGLAGIIGNLIAGWLLRFIEINQMYQLATAVSFTSIFLLWIKRKTKQED